MVQAVVEVERLPESPLDAAARFHAHVLPQLREQHGEDIVLLFDPADHSHQGWRLSAVQELAREMAPARVNAVVGGGAEPVKQALAYLANAPGVTGQILYVDAIGAEIP